MPLQLAQIEGSSFTPSTLMSLFVLDGTNIGMEAPFEFLDGTSTSYTPVIFGGVSYIPFPIQAKGFAADGTGKIPRPTLVASNINGFVSNLLLQNQNLIGARVIRRRVWARFLDNINWPNGNPYGTPDPTAAYPDETWYVNRKITENQQTVEWELGSLFEVDGVKLPRRQVNANICGFKYRDPNTCGYSGVPIADRNGMLFVGGTGTYGLTLNSRGTYSATATYNAGDYATIYSTLPQFINLPIVYVCVVNGTTGNANSPLNNNSAWVQDACPKSIAGCKLRFPITLRFGGFPGVSLAPYIVSR